MSAESLDQRAGKIVHAIEDLVDAELAGVVEQRDAHLAAMGRIRTAAQSDADLQNLPPLRNFLLEETKAAEPSALIGHTPDG